MTVSTGAGDRYRPLDERTLPGYLAEQPTIAARLGGSPSRWLVSTPHHVGDINVVHSVTGPRGGVFVKQALPYVRAYGDAMPLSPARAYFQYRAAHEHGRHVGRLVPEQYHYDPVLDLNVMEYLPLHRPVGSGLVAGIRYPRLAQDLAEYLARSLFFTSALAVPADELQRQKALFEGNVEQCRLMENGLFVAPYLAPPEGRISSPELESWAARIRGDAALKLAVSHLRLRYTSSAEGLLHGDMHPSAIMATADDTRLVDQEFAFYGPIGFDVGVLAAHLLVAYLGQVGARRLGHGVPGYPEWVLQTLDAVWRGFHQRFLDLWCGHDDGTAVSSPISADPSRQAAVSEERHAYLRAVFADCVGFCGVQLIAAVVGLVPNADLTFVDDDVIRASLEVTALRLGRHLLLHPELYDDVQALTAAAVKAGAAAVE